MLSIDLKYLLSFSAVFRLLLIIYGEWQDSNMEVRYTDVDYIVFSDAASLVSLGKSPYDRSTYRYSPILAFLLVPNSIIHHSWGKIIFSASDLLVGYFIYTILKLRHVPENKCLISLATWLFNPFTFTIGTRGNCEPIVCAMVLWIIICLMNGNILQAAFWYGFLVHFRIYPIIYSLTIMLVLDKLQLWSGSKPCIRTWSSKGQNTSPDLRSSTNFSISYWNLISGIRNFIKSVFTKERIIFGLYSGSMFFMWTGVFFYMYGWDFLNEALLYHLTRTDPRHNFSIYFYHIYLHHEVGFSVFDKLISFLPQFLVQLVLILCFSHDLPFCLFVQTVSFVIFNKVITAQYFVWFFCLLPLILPWSNMKLKWKGVTCIFIWIGTQLHWLLWGYLLEFKGKNVFIQLWLASILFLIVNTWVLILIIKHHRFSPLFENIQGRKAIHPTKNRVRVAYIIIS